jgi:PadR family transcriptional regulator PadR
MHLPVGPPPELTSFCQQYRSLDGSRSSLDKRTIPSYSLVMRRKPGTILPIEESILSLALELNRSGDGEFHGFAMAKQLTETGEARKLIAHGTLYKALSRMEKAGLLESRWEDPQLAADEGRPLRRLYRITGAGEVAYSRLATARHTSRRPDPGFATP